MTIMKNKSTQELFGATSEGLSAKSSYATPTIKVVTFQVEHGFAGSPDPLSVGLSRERAITLERQETDGSELFERQTLTAYN